MCRFYGSSSRKSSRPCPAVASAAGIAAPPHGGGPRSGPPPGPVPPPGEGPAPAFPPPFLAELLSCVQAGLHVMLMGPRGVGKTTAVRMAARRNEKDLH